MSEAETLAGERFEWLTTDTGLLVIVPKVTADFLRSQGRKQVSLTVELPDKPRPAEWWTVTEAAQRHCQDVDNLSLERAQVRISRACSAGKIRSEGKGSKRRIDPVSCKAWCLDQRDANLARLDDQE